MASQYFTSSSIRPIFGNGGAMDPMPQAPMEAACFASSTDSRRQQLPTWTITLNPAGTAAIQASASCFRSSGVSMYPSPEEPLMNTPLRPFFASIAAYAGMGSRLISPLGFMGVKGASIRPMIFSICIQV